MCSVASLRYHFSVLKFSGSLGVCLLGLQFGYKFVTSCYNINSPAGDGEGCAQTNRRAPALGFILNSEIKNPGHFDGVRKFFTSCVQNKLD